MKNLLLITGFCILAVQAEIQYRNQEPGNRGYSTIFTAGNKKILKNWHLENKNLVIEPSGASGQSRETIEWTQV